MLKKIKRLFFPEPQASGELWEECSKFALTGNFEHMGMLVCEHPSMDAAIECLAELSHTLRGVTERVRSGRPLLIHHTEAVQRAFALSVGLDRSDKNSAQRDGLDWANEKIEKVFSDAAAHIEDANALAAGLRPREWWGI